MNKSNRIQRQNCAVESEKPIHNIEDRQSSLDSCTTTKSSTITEAQASTLSNESKNSSGSQHTNSTDKTSSSQGSAEIEEKERTFGSINLHPLPDTQNKSLTDNFHGNYRFINQRLVNVQDTNLTKNINFRKLPLYDKPISPPNVTPSANPQCDINKPKTRITKIAEYILERTIGKGNFAVVKLATHSVIKTRTAIKIMNKSLLGMNNLEKVTREIEAMKRLEHPHIVKLYQVLETESKIFMVMEYAEKGEVFDHISHAHAFTEKDARELFWQVVCAINYCHKSSVVHRDLKAENLLLNSNYQIKVADFGFCNFFELHKLLSTHCGSPQYAAPEVFKGELYDGPLADVWSLGVVLYIMVCGSFPFPGESLGDIRNQVLRGLVRFPFFLSTSCEYLVRGMLQVDPTKRFRIEQIISTPWMQASNNVDKYRALMEIYNKKAIENKFEEIFHRQHPEHSDIIREQMYYCSKIKLDYAIQLALHMHGYDEDEIRNSVVNRSFDRNYAAYHLLKDKVCRFFNNPLLTLYLEAAHSNIINQDSELQASVDIPDILSSVAEETRKNLENQNNSRDLCGKKIYCCRRDSLSYYKNKFYSNSDVVVMAKLYGWVLQADEEYLLNKESTSFLDQNLTMQLNVRRHTVQLTEMPNELRTVSDLVSISPGFPKSNVQSLKEEGKDEPENKVKVSSVFRKKQMSLDSTRSQTSSKLNIPHTNSKLIKSRYLADIRNNEPGNLNYPPKQTTTYLPTTKAFQLSEISEHPTMDSDSVVDNDEFYIMDSNTQDVVMGSNDSTNWTVMKNLPQLNLPVNLPALVHQPMAKFTVKDPHLLAPPDFMTPYNSCFPRRSSDGAADMQPLHRSNPGVGGSYPEQSAHKYRSQNEFLYDAVVQQMVPSSKENYINEISPLEFMGLHLKRFSLPMNGSYNISNTPFNEESRFNTCLENSFIQSTCSDSPIGNRRGSEDSQMSLWHKRVARSGYIDSGSPRGSMFASAPSSRGGSPYPTKSCSATGVSLHSSNLYRKKSGKYRSTDHLSRNYTIHSCESSGNKERSIPKLYENCEPSQDSSTSLANPSQPGLDLQELKAELQNLAVITNYKDECSKTPSNTSLMVIPSISLSPIEHDSILEESISGYTSKGVGSQKKFSYSVENKKKLVMGSITCSSNSNVEKSKKLYESTSLPASNEEPNQYQKHPNVTSQMYFHWFPGFIHSISKISNSEYKIPDSIQIGGIDTKVDCELLSCQPPLPLPYYSPFMRDEDAADLAAIERVNRKLSQTDNINLRLPKKDTVPLVCSTSQDMQSSCLKPIIRDETKDTKFGSGEMHLRQSLSLQESHSAMELSGVNVNRPRPLKRQLMRGFSAEETHVFAADCDSSMDCDLDQKLSIIQEQMDSS